MMDRVEFTKSGKLDEIVSSRGAHIEYIGDGLWFLIFGHEDGTETALWFESEDLRKPNWETREARKPAEAVPQGGGETPSRPTRDEHIAWMQRRDAEYYDRAMKGYDPFFPLSTKVQLQREAAKASRETRNAVNNGDKP